MATPRRIRNAHPQAFVIIDKCASQTGCPDGRVCYGMP